MSKKGCFFVAVGVLSIMLCTGFLKADVFGKANEADSLYGKGVHAFFDADYQGAAKLLAKVEELGSEDPRSYFFLGLAQLRLGQIDKAEATLEKAAAFEWTGRTARDFNVSDALKRIQGKERLYVESFRRQAKLDWEKADQNRQRERYGKRQVENRSILAKLAKGSDLPPPKQESTIGTAPFGARSIDPFRVSDEPNDADKLIPIGGATPTAPPQSEKTDEEKGDTKDDGDDPFR